LAAFEPFGNRIGTAIFAAVLPIPNLIDAFEFVNVSAGVLAAGAMTLWLRIFVSTPAIRIILSVLFCLAWSHPIRFAALAPMLADPMGQLINISSFCCVMLYAKTREIRYLVAVAVLSSIGVAFREFALIPAFALLFVGNPINRRLLRKITRPLQFARESSQILFAKNRIKLIIPLICAVLALKGVDALTDGYGTETYLGSLVLHLVLVDFFRYLAAWFHVFGPALALIIIFGRSLLLFIYRNQVFTAPALAIGFLTWFGGLDHERYLIMEAPFVLGLVESFWSVNAKFLLVEPFSCS